MKSQLPESETPPQPLKSAHSTPTSTDSNNKLGERMERGVTTLTELIRHYKNSEVSERSVCEYVERIIDEESHLHAPNSYVGRTVKSIKRRLSL